MEGFCRGCLIKYNEPMELLQYTEKNRRLFVYSTGLQVKRNDTFTFQLCKDCFLNMKQACKFKKMCRTSDKRFKNYLALKDVGDPVDFCTFLKNSDNTLTFRLPMGSGNSTPATQKCRDDDNESTCTSIRNFMTDILQGEELPDTEARIIKEVIEEEADVLEDSLDSQWMQDDMSIDADFRLDFSFSPFSTPNTVNNDRCYTPKQTEEQVTFDTLNSKKQTKILNDFTNAFKTDENVPELDVFGGKVSSIEETDSLNNSKQLCPFGIENDGMDTSDGKTDKSNRNLKELSDFGIEDIDSIHKTESITLESNRNLKELCDLGIHEIDGNENSKSKIESSNQSLKNIINNLHVEEIKVIGKSENNNSKNNHDLKQLFDLSLDGISGAEKAENKTHKNVLSLKELCDFSLDSIGSIERPVSNSTKNTQNLKELYDLSLNSFEDTAKSGSNTLKTDRNVKDICDFGIDDINGTEKSESNLDLPSLPSDVFGRDKMDTPDFDIPKGVTSSIQSGNDISNGSINIEALLKDKPCPIDKNLEEALKNTENTEFSLDNLLVSPPAFPAASAASTPTITNILFGEKLDTPNSNEGQGIDPYYDVQGDIEIFEEFFQNDTKEFDFEDIKRENAGFNSEHWKKPIDAEVDNKENEFKNVDMDMSIDDKDQIDNKDTAVIKSEKETITYFSDTSNDKFDIENSYCKLCKIKYDSGRALSVHFSKTHNIKIIKPRNYKKNNDTAVTESKNDSTIYVSDKSVNDNFDLENGQCKLCDKSYKTRRALSIHFSKIHNIKIVKSEYNRKSKTDQICNHCGEIWKDPSNFSRHLRNCQRNEMKESIFKCDRCLSEFTTQIGLEKHKICHTQMQRITKTPRKEYVCTFCGVIIYKQSNLVLHMRRHTKDYSTKCEVCDKGFYRQTDLKVHLRIHTGETPFACKFCPRLFARRDVLTRHLLAHLGEKLFECDYCNKRHLKKCDLIKHIKTKSCRTKRKRTCKKKIDIDKPIEKQDNKEVKKKVVTVSYAKGSDAAIRKQKQTKRNRTHKENMDLDIPIETPEDNKEVEKEKVTVMYAEGCEATIINELPFLETERSKTKRKITREEKMDIDIPIEKPEDNKEVEKEEVTVTYANGREATIINELPFLETERSN